MSNSKFKVIENKRPEVNNLVIVVNKAGQVSTDTELLQNLLTNDEEISTGISILRETSPTPSIEEEVSKLKNSSMEDFLDDEDDDGETLAPRKVAGKIPHATLHMESYICSSEARRFANDVLHLGGIDPQSLLKPIDFEFRRRVVQNDHCYTNLMFDSDKKKSVISTSAKHSAGSSAKSNSSSQAKSATIKNQHIREKVQSDSEESDNEDEKAEEEQSEDEISYTESDDEDDMDFNVNDRFGRQKGKRKRKYRKHKQKQSTFKDFLETGEISMPDDEHKRKYGKKQKKQSVMNPKMTGNTKLSQETSTFKTNRPIKKAPVQSSSKDLSTLSFSVLEKSELDANFGMPKVKTETIEKLQVILPTSKNSQAQAQHEKEKERIVKSIAKDLETSFPEPILDKSKEKSLSMSEKISNPTVDLTQLKELDSTDEEIGDAIFAVLGENALDELLNQSDLINFETNQTQTPHQTNDSNEVNVTGEDSIVPATDKEFVEASVSTMAKGTIAKEPTIKVVRNGRIIILPPIEKPATRGSKRKSTSDISNTQEVMTVVPPPMTVTSTSTTVGIPAKVLKTEKSPLKETNDSKNSSRRSSLNRSESGRSRNSLSVAAEEETDDLVSDASCASEDDPERLWCICKQPHNNRFMICCDKCEEWFHGKCVNVSKAMGKVIEQGKREWNCPKCKNGSLDSVPGNRKLNQSKLTKFFSNRNKQSAMCIVCKKKASNEGSSFCSDECMQNHSNLNINILNKSLDKEPAVATETKDTSLKIHSKKHENSNNKNASDFLFSNPVKINTNSTNNKTLQESKSIVVIKSHISKGAPTLSRQTSNNQIPKLLEKIKDEKPPQGKISIEKMKAEQERKNVKSILADTLKARMQNFDHHEIPKMNDEQIESFAVKVENEMFLFFNRDTRDKYKTKYRSLKFNLGDVKNKTLIERICSNKLSPKQLVHLSSADLASEDLAKWREHENKHQLEIITKSELESLAQTKVVLKSHKGEEIIESKDDIQDVELVISKTILKVGDRSEEGNLISSSAQNHHESRHHIRGRKRSRSRSKDKERHHKSSHSKHRRSRSRSRSRNHKGSTSSKSHDKSKRSSDHKHKRSRSKSRDKSKRNSDPPSKDDQQHHHHHHHHKHEKHHEKHHKHEKSEKHSETKVTEIIPEKEDVDLVGKILDSMGVHVNLERKETHEEEKNFISESLPVEITMTKPVAVEKVMKEVHILRGNLTVPDISNFDIVASKLSGNLDDWLENFHQLDMIGRIEPKVVWDYVEKIKKSPGRELGILRISSEDDDSYQQTFNHLMSRQRFGVIKGQIPTIKDFYIFPLGKNEPLPKMLMPLVNGPGFIEGEDYKPDLLIGIVIKIVQDNRIKKTSIPYRKKTDKSVKQINSGTTTFESNEMRAKSKQSSILTLGLPELHSLSAEEAQDEPYEPYDEDIPSSRSQTVSSKQDDLRTQMELIDKQIEERKIELQNLAQKNLLDLNEEEAKRIYENVELPDNLTEILSKISSVDVTSSMQTSSSHHMDEEYVPTAITDIPQYTASTSYSHSSANQPIVNEMMDIDERVFPAQMPVSYGNHSGDHSRSILSGMTASELLKLVPDDETILS